MGKTKIEMIDSSKGEGKILVPNKVKINGTEVLVASAEIESMGGTHGTSAVLVRLELYPDELIIRGEEETDGDRSLDEILRALGDAFIKNIHSSEVLSESEMSKVEYFIETKKWADMGLKQKEAETLHESSLKNHNSRIKGTERKKP